MRLLALDNDEVFLIASRVARCWLVVKGKSLRSTHTLSCGPSARVGERKVRDPHTVPQTAFLALRQGASPPAPPFMSESQQKLETFESTRQGVSAMLHLH